jgi:hypothetical protein
MSDESEQITQKIKDHLKQLVKTAGLPDTEESQELLEQGWKDKLEAFDKEVSERNMEGVDEYPQDDPRGALMMTYSGSLLSVGPLGEEGRAVEYRSIGIRADVPETARSGETNLAGDVAIDQGVEFTNGPIQKSSPIFKIAVISEEIEDAEQEEMLSEVTQILTDDFVEVNKTIIQE